MTPQPKPGAIIEKPYQFLVEYREYAATTGMRRFFVGLKGPANKDLLASANSGGGNAGNSYSVFLNNGAAYKYAGEIFLHDQAFEVLKTKHFGVNDILAYLRDGADSGVLVTYEYDGKQFLSKTTVKIKADEFDQRLKMSKVEILATAPGVVW
jgi:hypothetical protein